MKSIKNIRKEMKLSGLMLIVCLVGVVGCGSEPLEKEVGHSMLNETSGREQDKTCSDMETMMSFDNEIEEKTPVAAITETTDSTTEGEVDTEAVDKNEPAAVIATENLGNTQEETEQAYVQTGSIEAHLRREHYAGEVLVATDFDVRVTMPDGRVLRNPRGWTATPLELSQGENIITIAYDMLRVQISVNADNRTENTNTGQQDVVVQEDTIVPPAVLSSNQIFSLQGASVLMETVDMGQEYLDKIIFLGDSRTYSFKAYGVLSGGKDTTQVWVPRSGTMSLSAQSYERIVYPETGIEITIREAVVMKQPEYLVIGLGANGVSFMGEEVFKEQYRSLINDIKVISPGTKIMINSIFPIARYYGRQDLINNQKIAECNRWMMEVAQETGVKYLNTAEVLADAEGFLADAYDNHGDGMHLNRPGDEVVMQYIRTHAFVE